MQANVQHALCATCLVCKSSAYDYKGNAPVPAAAAGEVGSAVS